MRSNFIYNCKKYPFNLGVFNEHASYFSRQMNQSKENDEIIDIQLISDFENITIISEKSIQEFINYCQNRPYELDDSTAISIFYLSHKYEVPNLIKLTEKYISSNINSIKNIIFNAKNIDIQSEQLITKLFNLFIDDDRLILLPISTLYRILDKNSNEEQFISKNERKIVHFIMKCIDYYGELATVLLSPLNFSCEMCEYMNECLSSHKNIIGNQIVQTKLIENLISITSQNKEKFENQMNEYDKKVNEMKNEYDKKIFKMENEYKSKLESIENSLLNEIKSLKTKIKENKKQSKEKILDLSYIQFYNDNSIINNFNKLSGEKQALTNFVLKNINKNNEFLQNIDALLSFISKEHKKFPHNNNLRFIYIQSSNEGKSLNEINEKDKIFIQDNTISMLYNVNTFKSSKFASLLQSIMIDNVFIDLKSSTNYYQEVYDYLSGIFENNSTKIKIQVTFDSYKNNNLLFQNDKYIYSLIINLNKNENYSFKEMSTLEIINVLNDSKLSFDDCKKLRKIECDPKKTNPDNLSFNNCPSLYSLKILSSEQTFDQPMNHYLDKYKMITKISFSKSIKTIGKNAFSDCTNLTKVKMHSSIYKIEDFSFSGCKNLREIKINPSAQICYSSFQQCPSIEHLIINRNCVDTPKILKYFPRNVKVTLSTNDSYISRNSFENSSIYHIVILSSVNSILDYSFHCCRSLVSVEIHSLITNILPHTFECCSSLTTINIPPSVISIGEYAFQNCSSLTKITIPPSVKSIGRYAFSDCKSLTDIEIPSSVTSIDISAFQNCSSLTKIKIPSSVTSIRSSTFSSCESLTDIEIPSSVTSICNNAFQNCSSLTKITIPSSVTSIEYSAFSGCKSLTDIEIPPSVTSIRDHVFQNCSSLTKITIPSSVTSIRDHAFQNCSSLTKITIPSSVISIGPYAFSDCKSLTDIEIPPSVISIFLLFKTVIH